MQHVAYKGVHGPLCPDDVLPCRVQACREHLLGGFLRAMAEAAGPLRCMHGSDREAHHHMMQRSV